MNVKMKMKNVWSSLLTETMEKQKSTEYLTKVKGKKKERGKARKKG